LNPALQSTIKSLVYAHVYSSVSAFDDQLGEEGGKKEPNLVKIFKFPTVTYLTSSVFESLIKQLEQSVSVINSKKTQANLTQ
jgi:hypothetical protein